MTTEPQPLAILLVGSLADGWESFGPFESWDKAVAWATDQGYLRNTYVLMDLWPPK